MDFFDKLSKSVTEASQKTIAKTMQIADTSRLNSIISEQEKLIDNLCYQIGKIYVTIHREDFEEKFAGLVRAVNDAENKIKECQKQIQDLKGVQFCEKCGSEVPTGASFCVMCGTSITTKSDVVENINVDTCANCGATIEKGIRFCTNCGKPILNNVVSETPVASMKEIPVSQEVCVEEVQLEACDTSQIKEETSIIEENNAILNSNEEVVAASNHDDTVDLLADRYCPNCGTKAEGDLPFCAECGTRL